MSTPALSVGVRVFGAPTNASPVAIVRVVGIGHGIDSIVVHSIASRCGFIQSDGIGLHFAGEKAARNHPMRGACVIPWEDLEAAYLAIKEAREQHSATLEAFCPEICPGGRHAGYVCCAPKGHDGDHIVTCGAAEPPFYVVVDTWAADRVGEDGAPKR